MVIAMKVYAGKILMLLENYFLNDNRVRQEAFTLTKAGYKVSVIALRVKGERAREEITYSKGSRA